MKGLRSSSPFGRVDRAADGSPNRSTYLRNLERARFRSFRRATYNSRGWPKDDELQVRRRHHLLVTSAILLASVSLSAPARAAATDCSLATDGTVTLAIDTPPTATLAVGRTGSGTVDFSTGGAFAPCGSATTSNTTAIQVTGTDAQSDAFALELGSSTAFFSGLGAANFAVSLGTGQTDVLVVEGTGGADTIGLGADGLDLDGTTDADVALTSVETSTLNGRGGEDTLTGQGPAGAFTAALMINGGAKVDTLVGGAAADVINGGGGNDAIRGLAGPDSLVGSLGDDLVAGGLSDDVLNGGLGDDALRGGLGTDTCLQGPGTGDARGCERFDLQPTLPIVAAFYYPWYPEGWTSNGVFPDTNYRPSLGFYDSGDRSVIRAHIRAMRYGGIEVGISSWWGRGHPTDDRVARLLRAAVDTTFRWAIYYEPEGYGDPSIRRIRADLTYIQANYTSDQSFLRIGTRPVIFVYNADDADCSVVDRWDRANEIDAYLVLKVFEGYRDCPVQPAGWHQYGPALAEDDQSPYSFSISPGFWKIGEHPRLSRDPTRWLQEIRDMLGSGARFQLITTFNEWIEGTSVESAEEWASDSGFGTYLDAMHDVILG